jgi:hypothetical protein
MASETLISKAIDVHTPKAIEALREVLDDPTSKPTEIVAAAKALIELESRGVNAASNSDTLAKPAELTDDQLLRIINEARRVKNAPEPRAPRAAPTKQASARTVAKEPTDFERAFDALAADPLAQ